MQGSRRAVPLLMCCVRLAGVSLARDGCGGGVVVSAAGHGDLGGDLVEHRIGPPNPPRAAKTLGTHSKPRFTTVG